MTACLAAGRRRDQGRDRSGMLAPGDSLPSVQEMSALQGVPDGDLCRHAAALADEGLSSSGRAAPRSSPAMPRRTQRSSAAPASATMTASAPDAAARMQADDGEDDPEYPQHPVRRLRHGAALGVDRPEPGGVSQASRRHAADRAATPPEDVAKVIAEGRKTHPVLALYLWLVAITGARRGELCALQVRDIDLDQRHPAHRLQLCRPSAASGSGRTPRPTRTGTWPSTR